LLWGYSFSRAEYPGWEVSGIWSLKGVSLSCVFTQNLSSAVISNLRISFPPIFAVLSVGSDTFSTLNPWLQPVILFLFNNNKKRGNCSAGGAIAFAVQRVISPSTHARHALALSHSNVINRYTSDESAIACWWQTTGYIYETFTLARALPLGGDWTSALPLLAPESKRRKPDIIHTYIYKRWDYQPKHPRRRPCLAHAHSRGERAASAMVLTDPSSPGRKESEGEKTGVISLSCVHESFGKT
jgi:hypothetical protein